MWGMWVDVGGYVGGWFLLVSSTVSVFNFTASFPLISFFSSCSLIEARRRNRMKQREYNWRKGYFIALPPANPPHTLSATSPHTVIPPLPSLYSLLHTSYTTPTSSSILISSTSTQSSTTITFPLLFFYHLSSTPSPHLFPSTH